MGALCSLSRRNAVLHPSVLGAFCPSLSTPTLLPVSHASRPHFRKYIIHNLIVAIILGACTPEPKPDVESAIQTRMQGSLDRMQMRLAVMQWRGATLKNVPGGITALCRKHTERYPSLARRPCLALGYTHHRCRVAGLLLRMITHRQLSDTGESLVLIEAEAPEAMVVAKQQEVLALQEDGSPMVLASSSRDRTREWVKSLLENPYYMVGLIMVDVALGAALFEVNPLGDDPSWLAWVDLTCGCLLTCDLAARIVSTSTSRVHPPSSLSGYL